MNNKIFLIGFMGSGKSSVGKLLAQKTKFRLYDTDEIIEKKENKSVMDIFKTEGENHFRALEQTVIRELINSNEAIIISTGGGLPCYNDLISEMNTVGVTVYLKCQEEVLFERIKREPGKRPLIENESDQGVLDFIRKKLAERSEIYESATICVDANKSAEKVVAEIIDQLKLQVE